LVHAVKELQEEKKNSHLALQGSVPYMCHMRRRIHVSYEEEDTCA